MYLLAKFGGNSSYGNRDTRSYINANMITSEEIFKIRNIDLQFRSPGEDGHKNLGNCQSLCLTIKRNKKLVRT